MIIIGQFLTQITYISITTYFEFFSAVAGRNEQDLEQWQPMPGISLVDEFNLRSLYAHLMTLFANILLTLFVLFYR